MDDLSQVLRPVLNMPQINGDITLASPTTETTVGSAGSASAMPTPVGYIIVNIGGSGPYKLAYFNV